MRGTESNGESGEAGWGVLWRRNLYRHLGKTEYAFFIRQAAPGEVFGKT